MSQEPTYPTAQPAAPPPGYTNTTFVLPGPQTERGHPSLTPAGHVPVQRSSATRFQKDPMQVVCDFCEQTVTTTVHKKVGGFAYGISAILVLSCCWLGCCLVPCFMDDCKDSVHMCPNCKKQIGLYARLRV